MKPERSFNIRTAGVSRWWPWGVGGLFVVVLAIRDVLLTSNGVIDHSVYWGRDFINMWTGGQLIRLGRLDILYDLQAYAAYQQSLFGQIGPHNYSYPPVSFPLATLVSLLPYPLALVGWLVATGALFIVACRSWWPREAGPVALAVVTPAALVNIWAGHYGFLIGALFLLGWQQRANHPLRAGILFGLMLIKPHLAILVPIVLLIRGEWRVIGAASATVVVLVGATTAVYGVQPWADFLFRTTAVQAGMIDAGGQLYGLMSPSVASAMLQLGSGWTLALTAQLVFAMAAIGMVAIAAYRASAVRDVALLTATATFLVLPYAFNYDLTVVMVGALVVLHSANAAPVDRRLALYGFIAPQLGMVTAALHLPLMPLMLLGLAIAQFRLCCARARRAEPTGVTEPDGRVLDLNDLFAWDRAAS